MCCNTRKIVDNKRNLSLWLEKKKERKHRCETDQHYSKSKSTLALLTLSKHWSVSFESQCLNPICMDRLHSVLAWRHEHRDLSWMVMRFFHSVFPQLCCLLFTSVFPWLWDLSIPVPTQLAGEHTASVAITALETIQTHKQSLSNQVLIYSWVERVHIQVKCLVQEHNATPPQPRPVPEISRPKVTGRSHRATTPCIISSMWLFRYRDTEGGHCQEACGPQRSFYVLLIISQVGVIVRATWDIESPVLKSEK